jgi:hypothetical protein
LLVGCVGCILAGLELTSYAAGTTATESTERDVLRTTESPGIGSGSGNCLGSSKPRLTARLVLERLDELTALLLADLALAWDAVPEVLKCGWHDMVP